MKKKTFIVQLLDSKKPNRKSFTQVEDANFYSNDTDASLVFIPHEDTFDFESAKVVMYNRGDESLVERDMVVAIEDGRKVASYEMPDEIIAHWGDWTAQPVFINGGEIYSGSIVPFSVFRYLMHDRPPRLNEVVTITKFIQQSQALVNDMVQEETQRVTQEQARQSAEAVRVQAENERSVKYESYAQQFNDVITDLSEEKDYHSLPEISAARGGHDTLGERLDDTTAQLAQKANQSFVDSQLASIVSGAPKGTYTDLASLQSAYPSGAEGIFLVLSDGHWYYWQATTSMWEDGGLYQSSGIANGSITREKIAVDAIGQDKIDAKITTSPNVLDSSSLTAGQYMYGDVGAEVTQRGGANWSGKLQAIPVKVGDVVRFNLAYQGTYFVGVNDQNIVLQIGPVRATAGDREIIVEAGVTKFYTTVFNQYVSEAMITINQPMPDTYTPFGIGNKKKLQWLEVDENNLSVTLQDKINSPSTGGGSSSNWTGARMITAGDSITWQDGNGGVTGWQTHVKNNLDLANVTNIAVSGRPMVDGTANGAGTVTSIISHGDFSVYNLGIIASGTNDFKLNVSIDILQPIGSVYDRNTFYGAYQTAIEHIINSNPSIKLILFTPLHRNNGGYNSTGFVNTAGHTLDDYRQAIFKLGELYSLPVIDMFAESGINLLTLSVDTRDGLHPNDNGYLKMGLKASVGINNA